MSESSNAMPEVLIGEILGKDPQEIKKTLEPSYILENEPWTPFNFPEQYMPWFGPDHEPPCFYLGAVITMDDWLEYSRYAESATGGKCTGLATGFYLAQRIRLPEYLGPECEWGDELPLSRVRVKGKKAHMLQVCSNRSFGSEFPDEQCRLLMEELRNAGIRAKFRWCLPEDWWQWFKAKPIDSEDDSD
ncbi:hypothetical protein K435DRAFT_871142 [Dendrothele bispora CBS 962.96]|uniref:Uncharacterized protein n=1 Tax=Dendrothele bispora (strain CBS 962.96) TaxID=1314807 RepID=A0A4V6T527_DENBC|nr:hypothetical protein K435DRAFT_871142 [Dendrothele bispora CBS 962.96]